MQPLEHSENPIEIFFLEANAIVLDEQLAAARSGSHAPPEPIGVAAGKQFCTHFHHWGFILSMKLQRVSDEVLQYLPHLRGIRFESWQLTNLHTPVHLLDPHF